MSSDLFPQNSLSRAVLFCSNNDCEICHSKQREMCETSLWALKQKIEQISAEVKFNENHDFQHIDVSRHSYANTARQRNYQRNFRRHYSDNQYDYLFG